MNETAAVKVLLLGGRPVVVWLHDQRDVPGARWARLVEIILQGFAEHGRMERQCHLILTDGGAPNTAQRASFQNDIHQGLSVPVGIVTSALTSPLKRGIATAVTWRNPQTKFFQPEAYGEALAYLGLGDHREALWSALEELQAEVSPVHALETIAEATGQRVIRKRTTQAG